MVAKNEEAGKPKTRSSPSNPDEEESEELKETPMEQKDELGAKNDEAGKLATRLVQEVHSSSNPD